MGVGGSEVGGQEETPSSAGTEVAKPGGTGVSDAAPGLFALVGADGSPIMCPWPGFWTFWPQFFQFLLQTENSPAIVSSF